MTRILSLVALIGASAWFGSAPHWEPFVAIVVALSALLLEEHRFVKTLAPLGSPARETAPVDRQLLDAFLRDFPADGPLQYFASRTAAYPFVQTQFFALDEVAQRWSSADREFLSSELESAKRRLIQSIASFTHYVALNTFPVDAKVNGVSNEWRREDRDATIKLIDSTAQELFQQYEGFVRLARRVLLPTTRSA